MIPGPVAGRAPIDPNAAQRPPAETAGDAADSGASFADLLAAMLAPGAAGAQLQASASGPAEAVFERLDAAEVFNETGLFRGAAPLPSAEADPSGVPASETVAAAPGRNFALAPDVQAELQAALSPADGEVAAAPGVAIAAAGAIGSGSVPASGAAAAKAALPSVLPLNGQPVSASGAPAAGAEAGGEAAAPGRVPPRTATMVAQLLAARAGAAAAQVSVQAVEGGISVTARADKLSREERDRLREEIGALLASHGFGGAQIWLNGEAWPLPRWKED